MHYTKTSLIFMPMLSSACASVDPGPPWESTVRCKLDREQEVVFAGVCVAGDESVRAIRLTSLGEDEPVSKRPVPAFGEHNI